MDLGAFLLILGAGARTSFFFTDDRLTKRWRDAAVARKRRNRAWWVLAWLLTCPWCNSPYWMALWAAWWYLAPDRLCFDLTAGPWAASLIWGLVYTLHQRAITPPPPPPVPMGPRRGTITTSRQET